MTQINIEDQNRWLSAIKNPRRTWRRMVLRYYRSKGEQKWLEKWFEYRIGYKPNFCNPETFNEKLNWLKLHDHNPLYHTLVDKYEVKKYVASVVGSEHVCPVYGVWNSFDEIDFDSLPDSFVLKPTKWGVPVIVKDKKQFDKTLAKHHIDSMLGFDIYPGTLEWSYKDVKPRVLAEKYLDDGSFNVQLQDYKFWCFGGKPTIMYLSIQAEDYYENWFDMDFNPLSIDHKAPRHKPEFEKPKHFEEMKELAAKLSKDIPFVRMDFFSVGETVYFGEFTFYDWGGGMPFGSYEQDLELGKYIDLSLVKNLE